MSNEGKVIITGTPDDNEEVILQEYSNGAKHVRDTSLDRSAFGELAISEATPVTQETFSYNINLGIWHDHSNNGTATVVDHQLNLSTGAATNQSAEILSKVPIKYNAGQGACVRFSGLYTTGVAGSQQIIGVIDPSDGLGFGFDGVDFGVVRRSGGHQEIRTLTITTGSSTAENITITLDGDSDATVAVTASGNTDTTANEIAAHDFSSLGRGWEVHSDGDGIVLFVSYDAETHSGAYSYSATTMVGTFAQDIAGVSKTDTWTPQSEWNKDKAGGAGRLPIIDFTKGNVFQIIYQWLGYGHISFFIEHPSEAKWVEVHRIEYANKNIVPSFNSPTIPLYYNVENTTNTTDIVIKSGSIGGFIQGRTNGSHQHHGVDTSTAGVTAEQPILTLHNPLIFSGVPNRVRLKLVSISVSADGTKPVIFRIKRDVILTGASYGDVETAISVAEFDTSATTISGGDKQFTVGVGRTGSEILDLSTSDYFLNPAERITVTAQSANSTDVVASYNWEERF